MNNNEYFLQYKGSKINVSLPDTARVFEALLSWEKAEFSGEKLTRDAIRTPCGGISFEDFIGQNNDEKVLIIINDQTRPTPTRTVLEAIHRDLPMDRVTVLVATGIHRGPTESEFREIFGSCYDSFRSKIVVHDARDENELEYLGTTSFGTNVIINKLVCLTQKIIVIGSVEPHYFAGYTGGRKGFFPGVSGFETIENNHKLALDINAKSLKLKGNPVHEDMMEAMRFLNEKSLFSIMTVLDSNHDIFAVTAGEMVQSFSKAVEIADRVFVSDIEEKADVVISVAKHPMDLDLYQSQKAIDNGKLALKEDGILILVSACLDGAGEKSFIELLSTSSSPEDVLERIEKEYRLGWHKAAKMAEVFLSHEVWAFTELEDKQLEDIFIKPYTNIKDAIEDTVAIKGEDLSILIIPDGCITVPRVKIKGEKNDKFFSKKDS